LYISRKERENSVLLQLNIHGWQAVRATYFPRGLKAKFWFRNEQDKVSWIKSWEITNINEQATIQIIRALYSNLKEFPVVKWDDVKDGESSES
jgi:hypothetical protein